MAKRYLKLSSILRKLLFDRAMKPIDLAREVNLPPPTIHRLVTGKSTRPYPSSLKPIADFFSISVDELLGEITPADSSLTTEVLSENKISPIPICKWSMKDDHHLEAGGKNIICAETINKNCFALLMRDTSMEPLFPRGSILIFDPDKKPQDRSYILVKLSETNVIVFRQLLMDVEHQYLKPLNPDLSAFKMRLLAANDAILGSLIESRHNFQANLLDEMEEIT